MMTTTLVTKVHIMYQKPKRSLFKVASFRHNTTSLLLLFNTIVIVITVGFINDSEASSGDGVQFRTPFSES